VSQRRLPQLGKRDGDRGPSFCA